MRAAKYRTAFLVTPVRVQPEDGQKKWDLCLILLVFLRLCTAAIITCETGVLECEQGSATREYAWKRGTVVAIIHCQQCLLFSPPIPHVHYSGAELAPSDHQNHCVCLGRHYLPLAIELKYPMVTVNI
ncbi:uncharacterized [Tachysurus ichikawai]